MATVGIDRVSKSYGNLNVIREISFDIAEGEFVALVGPSGCGKSTLLRMIAGLEPISGGTISIDDRVVNNLEPRDRDIAMVFQNYALYPHMNVADNMSFSLRLAGVKKADITTRVERAADILGLRPLLERFPRQLSGGQRQRVAMGRAIVRDPKVFLFDEPLSNLDAKLRVQMRAEIATLQQRLRTTTVYVTHDQVEAMTMAHKVVVMQAGNIEQVGAPLELYDRPVSLFVAGFIGSPSMNLFHGTIEEHQGAPAFRTASGQWLPLAPSVSPKLKGVPLVYGMRPEHLTVSSGGDAATIDVAVRLVETTGAETQILGQFGDDDITTILRERLDVTVGAQLSLVPNLNQLHLFDQASGLRI